LDLCIGMTVVQHWCGDSRHATSGITKARLEQ
jgi:hypothetical protein